MSVISRQTRFAVLLVTLCLAMSAGALLALVDTRPEKVKASEWAEANRTELPDTLDEISKYPLAYRRAAFLKTTAEVRYDLWEANLQQFASGPLTSEQRAVVFQLKNTLRPEYYREDPSIKDAKQAALGPICKRIGEIFSVEQRRMLATLGPTEGPRESRLVGWVRGAKAFLPTYIVNANTSPAFHDCDCADDTHCLDCPTWSYCGFSDGCSETWGGCGCAWAFSCVSLCDGI
jgi:hypothetical protein